MDGIEAFFAALSQRAPAHHAQTGRPLVTLSYAQSLDGSIAAQRGQPLALSGPTAQRLTHRLRAVHAAILVGVGTLLADDPRLNVRLVDGPQPQPVVLDTHLHTPPTARLFAGQRQPWIATGPGADPQRRLALQAAGARLLDLPLQPGGGLALPALLDCLGGEGLESLMVEGGASVLRAFLSQGLAQQALITIALLFVGGLHVLQGDTPLPTFPRLQNLHTQLLDDDLIVWGDLK